MTSKGLDNEGSFNNDGFNKIDPGPNDKVPTNNNPNKTSNDNDSNNNNNLMKGTNFDRNDFTTDDNNANRISSKQKGSNEPLINESSIISYYNLNKNDP